MSAKVTPRRLDLAFDASRTGNTAPWLLYANLDFTQEPPKPAWSAISLLRWLDLGSEWPRPRTLKYLQVHQDRFRKCMAWLSNDAYVDLGPGNERIADQWDFADLWEQKPEVRFLQKHGLNHAGLVLCPGSGGEGSSFGEISTFSGIKLAQGAAKDPLDPICGHLLGMLFYYGNVFVRQCRFVDCKRFFFPPTNRRMFCSDNCRANTFLLEKKIEADLGNDDKRRHDRAAYMREYRANPLVKKRPKKMN